MFRAAPIKRHCCTENMHLNCRCIDKWDETNINISVLQSKELGKKAIEWN